MKVEELRAKCKEMLGGVLPAGFAKMKKGELTELYEKLTAGAGAEAGAGTGADAGAEAGAGAGAGASVETSVVTSVVQPPVVAAQPAINVPVKQLTTMRGDYKFLYHAADIHIRAQTDRHPEYRAVFAKLYDYLRSVEADGCGAVVLVGDIFDNRRLYTSTELFLAVDFLTSLAAIMDVFLIAGNHDLNLVSDEFTPSILNTITRNPIPGVYYLRESGLYRCSNLVISVDSIEVTGSGAEGGDNGGFVPFALIPAEYRDSPEFTKIALYHGMMYSCRNSIGQVLGVDVKTSHSPLIYAGFDAVLLGDVHHHQYISPVMAYSSSLVQQSQGESVDGHGIIRWNLGERDAEGNLVSRFIEMQNETAFITVDVADQAFVVPDYPWVKRVYLRVRGDCKTTSEIVGQVLVAVNARYQVLSHSCEIQPNISKVISYSEEYTKQYDSTEMIAGEAKSREIPEGVVERMMELHNGFKEGVAHKEMKQYCWRIERLLFNNVLIYGGGRDNVIDFGSLPGLINIPGTNAIGKSTIINIILLAIWGKFSTDSGTFDGEDFINDKADKLHTEVVVAVGNDRYVIRRRMTHKAGGKGKPKAGNASSARVAVVTDIEICKIVDGVEELLPYADKADAFEIIENTICGLKQFLLTNVISSSIGESFLTQTDGARKKTLDHLFNLQSYDELLGAAKTYEKAVGSKRKGAEERLKEVQTNIAGLKKGVGGGELDGVDPVVLGKEIAEIGGLIEGLTREKDEIAREVQKITAEINKNCMAIDSRAPSLEDALEQLEALASVDTGDWDVAGLDRKIKELRGRFHQVKMGHDEINLRLAELRCGGDDGTSGESGDGMSKSYEEVVSEIAVLTGALKGLKGSLAKYGDLPNDIVGDVEELRSRLVAVNMREDVVEAGLRELDGVAAVGDGVNLVECEAAWSETNRVLTDHIKKYGGGPGGEGPGGGGPGGEGPGGEGTGGEGPGGGGPGGEGPGGEGPGGDGVEVMTVAECDAREAELLGRLHGVKGNVRQLEKTVNKGKRERKSLKERISELQGIIDATMRDDVCKDNLPQLAERIRGAMGGEGDVNGVLGDALKLVEKLCEGVDIDLLKQTRAELLELTGKLAQVRAEITQNEELLRKVVEDDAVGVELGVVRSNKLRVLRGELVRLDGLVKGAKLRDLLVIRAQLESNARIEHQIKCIERAGCVAEIERGEKELAGLRDMKKRIEKQREIVGLEADLAKLAENAGLEAEIAGLVGIKDLIDARCDVEAARRNLALEEANGVLNERLAGLKKRDMDGVKLLMDYNKSLVEMTGIMKVAEQYQAAVGRVTELEKEIVELERDENAVGVYKQIVGPHGIPSKCLHDRLKFVVEDINLFLEGSVDYTVNMAVVPSATGVTSELRVWAVKNGAVKKVQQLSGYEQFMLDLAVKRSLNRFSFMPKSLIFAIDEGLDCIHASNMEKFHKVLGRMRGEYQNVVVISPLGISHEIADHRIEIASEGGFSYLC